VRRAMCSQRNGLLRSSLLEPIRNLLTAQAPLD
jgi:hypothetical protein